MLYLILPPLILKTIFLFQNILLYFFTFKLNNDLFPVIYTVINFNQDFH